MSTEVPAEPEPTTEPTKEQQGATPDEALGEGGLKALNAEREARAVAEKAAKEALARVKEFEDRDKSEAQKQQEALEQAQKELAELTVEKTRVEVAAAKGVPAALLRGSTQEELEASADALIAFKGEQPKQKLIIPNEGGQPATPNSMDDWLRTAAASK